MGAKGHTTTHTPCPVTPCGGGVQGLLLDCDAATLTVWVNGERKGVAVRPGMTDSNDEPVARLEGPLRWGVDLVQDSLAAIAGPLPSPIVPVAGDAAAQ